MLLRRHKIQIALAAGLGGTLILLFGITVFGLTKMQEAKQQLNLVVNHIDAKSARLSRMRIAARERSVILLKMMLLKDPFDIDAEWMRFHEFGTEFAMARTELLDAGVSDDERKSLDEQGALTRVVRPAQLQAGELIRDGRAAEGRQILIDTVLPGQDRIFGILSDLIDRQQAASVSAVEQTTQEYRRDSYLIISMATVLTVVILLAAGLSLRYTSRSMRALASEKEQAEITLHSIGDAVITTDTEGRVVRMNAVAEMLTGFRRDTALNRPVREILNLVHEEDRARTESPVEDVLANGIVVGSQGDMVLSRGNGADISVEYSVAPIFDRDRLMTGAILVFRDVTRMRVLTRELAHQARHDSLTGLVNRREFERQLGISLEEACHDAQTEHWLCYLDLDQFKLINDSCGHAAGDEWLRQVAKALRQEVRMTDRVARMGGDEFGLLLRYCTSVEAYEIAERIRDGLQKIRFVWGNAHFTCTGSIGLIRVDGQTSGLYGLLSAADAACYVAKDQGRNRIHVYMPGDEAIIRRVDEMQWAKRIELAIEHNRLTLHYQPIRPFVAATSDMHFEILLGPLDDGGESVSPVDFIRAAERYNMMPRLDRWVLQHSFVALAELHAAGGLRHCTAAINLSAQSLCDDDFLDFVLDLIRRAPFDPRRLCFEITETAAIANLERASQFIASLKKLGCSFSLDDFGSGLSSFAYLKTLPVDYVKIDGCFVREMTSDPIDRGLVEAINEIGHVMGMRTIAESVEQPDAIPILREIGVDFVQGYAIARPAPLAELIARRRAQGCEGSVIGLDPSLAA